MNKQRVVYPRNRILFSRKTERHSDICYNLNEPGKHHVERSQTQKGTYFTIHLHEIFRIGKSIEIKRILVVAKD